MVSDEISLISQLKSGIAFGSPVFSPGGTRICKGPSKGQMLPVLLGSTKPMVFRGTQKSANQNQKLPVVAMFVIQSGDLISHYSSMLFIEIHVNRAMFKI